MRPSAGMRALAAAACFFTIPTRVFGADVLTTNSFTTCLDNSAIEVNKLDVSYNKDTRKLIFDVAGESKSEQNVTARLVVTAYGKQVYEKEFSPCEQGMTEMCPVPAAKFSSSGEQTVPEEFAKQIPAIAFSVPDLDGLVKMYLTRDADNTQLACVQSTVGNGKSLEMPAVKYVAAGIAAGSLALTGLSALSAAGTPGAAAPSPTFGEVFGWFQSMALSGMMSVKYPTVYQSFSSNFGFSTGLVSWDSMQKTIDNFRGATGGNLTENNYDYLKNATLVFASGANSSEAGSLKRRAIEGAFLFLRDGTEVNVDGETSTVGGDGSSSDDTAEPESKNQKFVKDIQGYVEQLRIPAPNTFMTLLLSFAIVVAAIIVLILLFKLILEAWSMMKPLPHSMESWRKRYWWRLAKAITNLIMLLYGIWVLYCIYQFTNGDSWAAKTLAGVTLGLFTAILGWFTFQIWSKAREAKKQLGDASNLYEDKEVWVRYSLFYDNYKKSYWWIFIPVIVYMFVRACVIAGAQSNGLVQTAGQLIVEALMLCLLLWTRPFSLKSSNIINCVIQTVRVLSVICILVFVEELGISSTTKTVTGVVLIVVQSVLTGVLAILIAVNALIFCIKKNPHRQRRKEAEKEKALARDLDNLTPLDARNSLLMEPMSQKSTAYKAPIVSDSPFGATRDQKGHYDPVPPRPESPSGDSYYGRSLSRPTEHYRDHSADALVHSAADMGYRDQSSDRQPRLPDVYGYGQAK